MKERNEKRPSWFKKLAVQWLNEAIAFYNRLHSRRLLSKQLSKESKIVVGTEAGKIRPVIIVQTDLLNKEHPLTIVCPITTNINQDSKRTVT